jgi:hypothetical protein
MTARITLLPSARRLIDSLRDIGYDLPAAVADIVDNSIAARASRIDISFRFAGLDSWICIADNGHGMTAKVLEEAMRYGTQRRYSTHDLGRFGLGLKTASLSQCRCLTVASRPSATQRRIEIRRWDLDDVVKTNRWEVLRLHPDSVEPGLTSPLERRSGTVVMWQDLDRLLDYRLPDGAAAERGFEILAAEVRDHLAMVFHRFLSGEAKGRRRLSITVNATDVVAWDPFARTEPHTRELEVQSIAFVVGSKRRTLEVRPYILPPQQRFSSAAAHANAAGPARWNRQQGLYFYRNNRLVQGGGWNRLRTADEHTKLARIAIDLPDGSEQLFGLNVAKMRVTIPRDVRNRLMAIASGVAAEASINYRGQPRDAGRRGPTTPVSAQPAEARLVDFVDPRSLDVLRILASILRDELNAEPDILRRVLSRIDRASLSDGRALTERPEIAKPRTETRRNALRSPRAVSKRS